MPPNGNVISHDLYSLDQKGERSWVGVWEESMFLKNILTPTSWNLTKKGFKSIFQHLFTEEEVKRHIISKRRVGTVFPSPSHWYYEYAVCVVHYKNNVIGLYSRYAICLWMLVSCSIILLEMVQMVNVYLILKMWINLCNVECVYSNGFTGIIKVQKIVLKHL